MTIECVRRYFFYCYYSHEPRNEIRNWRKIKNGFKMYFFSNPQMRAIRIPLPIRHAQQPLFFIKNSIPIFKTILAEKNTIQIFMIEIRQDL